MGQVLSGILITLVVAYVGFRAWLWAKGRALSVVEFASPADAALELSAGAYVYDVRSHGYFDAKAIRIRGSRRLDPNALHQSSIDAPEERTLYVYCTCVRQATSTRVARELQKILKQKGVRVAVISGGLRAWTKAGLPVEAVPSEEIAVLPLFA
jgi:rhodanese-related sulfurtransferase